MGDEERENDAADEPVKGRLMSIGEWYVWNVWPHELALMKKYIALRVAESVSGEDD